MKRFLGAAWAAVAFAVATPAFAATFILTDDQGIQPAGPQTFSNFFVSGGNPVSGPTVQAKLLNSPPGPDGSNPTGAFLDRYIFAPRFLALGSGSSVSDFLSTVVFGNPGLQIDGYTLNPGIGAALLDAFTTPSQASYDTDVSTLATYLASAAPVFTQLGIPSGQDRQLIGVPLDPANFYVISINGTTDGTGGYAGTLTAVRNAVPEPTTWAMMLTGFGMIGFSMRRKRQSEPKVRFAF